MIRYPLAHYLRRRSQNVTGIVLQVVQQLDGRHETDVEYHIIELYLRESLRQIPGGHILFPVGTIGPGQRIVRPPQVVFDIGFARHGLPQIVEFGREPPRSVAVQRNAVHFGRRIILYVLQNGLHDGGVGRILLAILLQYPFDYLPVLLYDFRQHRLAFARIVRQSVPIDQHPRIGRKPRTDRFHRHVDIPSDVTPQIVVRHCVNEKCMAAFGRLAARSAGTHRSLRAADECRCRRNDEKRSPYPVKNTHTAPFIYHIRLSDSHLFSTGVLSAEHLPDCPNKPGCNRNNIPCSTAARSRSQP